MLTAWYRKDYARIPSYGVYKCKIGCSITCMQRHDHVGFIRIVICDIPGYEIKAVVSQLFSCFVAEIDDIFFQIESCDFNIASPYDLKIVIQREGKIAFSASEIDYPDSPIFGELIETGIGNFKKSVYLAEISAGERFGTCRTRELGQPVYQIVYQLCCEPPGAGSRFFFKRHPSFQWNRVSGRNSGGTGNHEQSSGF